MLTKLFGKKEVAKTVNDAEIMMNNLNSLIEKFKKINVIFSDENLMQWQKQWKDKTKFCGGHKTSIINNTICSKTPSITKIMNDLMNWLVDDVNFINNRISGNLKNADIEHITDGIHYMGLYVMTTLFLINNDNILNIIPNDNIINDIYENYRLLIGCTGEDNGYSYKFINMYYENRDKIEKYYESKDAKNYKKILEYLDIIVDILAKQCALLIAKNENK